MSLFGLDKVEGIEKDKDTVGGFQPRPSGIYEGTVEVLYVKVADSGAKALSLEMKLKDGTKYTEDMYFTSGTEKGGKHFTENNGVKRYLPGFNYSDAICRILIGKGLFDMTEDDIEDVVVTQRNKETKKDEPVQAKGICGVKGKTLILGLQRTIENGSKKVGNKWVKTNDKRTNTNIDRIFNEDGLTVNELETGVTEAKFIHEWKEANEGKDRNRFKEVEGAPAGGAGAPAASGGSTGGGKSLFG